MTLLIAGMFGAVVAVGLVMVAAYDLAERLTSRQGYPPSVFRRRP